MLRLVTVMGARGVRKHALLDNAVLEETSDALSLEEKKILRAAGWIPGTGLRTLLNYSARLWRASRSWPLAMPSRRHRRRSSIAAVLPNVPR